MFSLKGDYGYDPAVLPGVGGAVREHDGTVAGALADHAQVFTKSMQ